MKSKEKCIAKIMRKYKEKEKRKKYWTTKKNKEIEKKKLKEITREEELGGKISGI